MKTKKILVPLDFSDCSKNALRYALSMAKSIQGKLVLLHAYHIPVTLAEEAAAVGSLSMDDYKKEALHEIYNLRDEVGDLAEWVDSSEVTMGFALETIVNEAERLKVDFIVMGTQGASGFDDIILGSNTLNTIKRSCCPVLAVPEHITSFKINKILFAFDYGNIPNHQALKPLADLAFIFAAEIHVLHVTDQESKKFKEDEVTEAKKLEQSFKDLRHSYHIIKDEHIEHGIYQYIEEQNIDILAVMPRKHKLFEKLFHSSITRQLAHHPKVPLFAFHVE